MVDDALAWNVLCPFCWLFDVPANAICRELSIEGKAVAESLQLVARKVLAQYSNLLKDDGTRCAIEIALAQMEVPKMKRNRVAFNEGPKQMMRQFTRMPKMKTVKSLLTLVSVAAFLTGCDRPVTPASDTSSETTAKQLDKVRTDAKAAAQDMMDYAYAQKSEFLAKMQAQVDGMNRDLDELNTKIEKANDAVKAEAKPKIQALRDQVANLNKQLEDAKGANESAWNDIKSGFKKGFNELKDGFQQARQWVSEKIAP